jgi:hypothetical protein
MRSMSGFANYPDAVLISPILGPPVVRSALVHSIQIRFDFEAIKRIDFQKLDAVSENWIAGLFPLAGVKWSVKEKPGRWRLRTPAETSSPTPTISGT